MALHQTVDTETLARYKERAQRKYPYDDPETALNQLIIDKRISDVFFINEAGERCVWGTGECGQELIFCFPTRC